MNNNKAEQVIKNHVIININETIEHALNENPELLLEANNYEKVKKELNADNIDCWEWDEPDIYEFWAVDEWLYNRLTEEGEITFEYLDFYVWGRRTTGQAIYMDEVIQKIAEKIL